MRNYANSNPDQFAQMANLPMFAPRILVPCSSIVIAKPSMLPFVAISYQLLKPGMFINKWRNMYWGPLWQKTVMKGAERDSEECFDVRSTVRALKAGERFQQRYDKIAYTELYMARARAARVVVSPAPS